MWRLRGMDGWQQHHAVSVGNVWPIWIEMQLFQSFFAVDWPVEIMRGPNPFSVVSTAVDVQLK